MFLLCQQAFNSSKPSYSYVNTERFKDMSYQSCVEVPHLMVQICNLYAETQSLQCVPPGPQSLTFSEHFDKACKS